MTRDTKLCCVSLADGHSVARSFHPANVNIRVPKSPKRFQNELPIKAQHLCGLTREETPSRVLKYGQFETRRHVALSVFFVITKCWASVCSWHPHCYNFHKTNCIIWDIFLYYSASKIKGINFQKTLRLLMFGYM